jgi:hypothetical protein
MPPYQVETSVATKPGQRDRARGDQVLGGVAPARAEDPQRHVEKNGP